MFCCLKIISFLYLLHMNYVMCVVLDVPGMLPGEVTNETHYGHHRIPKGGWKRETRDIHQVNRDMIKEMGMNDPYSMTNFDSNACSYMKCKNNGTSGAATTATATTTAATSTATATTSTATSTTSTATTPAATAAATAATFATATTAAAAAATTPVPHYHNSTVKHHGHKHHNGTNRGHGHHHNNGSALHSLVNSIVGLAHGHGGDGEHQKPPTI